MNIFKDMPLFVAVANTLSFKRAAETLDMPSSSLSRRISDLEKSLGLKLFNRSTRQVELTEAGKDFYENCKKIILDAEAAHQQLVELKNTPSGLLKISAPADIAVLCISPLLAEFNTIYPEISLTFILTPSKIDLVGDKTDIGISIFMPAGPNVISRQISKMKCGLFASTEYIKKNGQPKIPNELLTHQCIRLSAGPWLIIDEDTKQEQYIEVNGKFTANSLGMCRQLALSGLGIFPGAHDFVRQDIIEGKIVQVLPNYKLPEATVFINTLTRLLPAKARVFIDFLSKNIGNEIRS